MGNTGSQQPQQPPPASQQQQPKKAGGQQQQKKKGRGAGSAQPPTERAPTKEPKGAGVSSPQNDQPKGQSSQRGSSAQQSTKSGSQKGSEVKSPAAASPAQKGSQPSPAPEVVPQGPVASPSKPTKSKKGAAAAGSPSESTPSPKQVQEAPEPPSVPQPAQESKTTGKGRGKKAAKQSEPPKPTPAPEPVQPPTPVQEEPPAPQPEPKPAGKGRGKKAAARDKPSEPFKATPPPEISKPTSKAISTPESSKPVPEPVPTQKPPIQEKVPKELPFQEAKPAGKGKGKKGGGGGDKPQESKPQAKSGPSKAASPIQDATKEIAKVALGYSGPQLLIPRRPQGQCITRRAPLFDKKLTIEVNYLPINFKDFNLKIFHYDVEFKPDRPKNLYRPALRMLLDKYVPRRHPAFDGKKNMYAGGTKLEFPNGESIQDTVEVFDPERGKEAEFEITVKLVAQNLSLSKLAEYLKSGTSLSIPQDVIQGIDIALRNAPIMNPNFVPVGRSFFAVPKPDSQPTDLGGGFELWHGHYQSAIMSWKPYLNVDVANKAFPIAQTVISFIYNDLKEDPEKELEQRAEYRLLRFLKGLKVDYKLQSNDPSGYTKRTYKVNDLGPAPSKHRFKPDKEGSREITVEQYFMDVKKIALKFPHLPTIVTSNKNFLPIEFCHISPNQAVMRKLDEKQTAQMVRSAAKGTDIRRERIMGTIGPSGFNHDPCAKEFGITLNTNFEKVEAHVLKAPLIRYANGNVPVRNGVWQTRNGEKFINSPGLQSWVIINTDRKIGPQQVNHLVKNFKQVGSNIGITVQDPREILNVGGNIRSEADFEREFRRFDKGIQILVVIMAPFGIDDIYGKIKRVAELKVGVLTQCLKAATCDFRKMNAMTAQNILLKINSKISGVNHSLAPSVLPMILREPVMIVGADVTHPAPGTDGLSIAAVAASHDSNAFKYNMLYRLQPGRQEMIERLQEMIEQQLRFFYQNCKCKPKRILYYRDGVSEGQFLQVLNIELRSIRAACKKLEDGYEPAVTFLVVQKRHHTRFFPGPRDWDGEKNKNVMAGTLVDCLITHPTEVDFYLVSHQSIQGTARPTKYHLLWDDNQIDQDELEQLTYYLCHMFARCNRSVSYPAPTYYAHLAAFRARAWWEGQRYDSSNLTREQETRGRIQDHIVKNAPMFFV